MRKDIAEAGEDWNRIIKVGGNTKLFMNKVKADAKYDAVGKLSEPFGAVALDSTMKSIDSSLKNLAKLPKTNKDAINTLSDLRSDLAGKKKGEKAQDLSFDEARDVRSTIRTKITDLSQGENSLVGAKGVEHLQEAKKSLDSDLEKFATSHTPELKSAWKDADSFYKENVVPFKDKQLAKALKAESGR